MTRRAAAILLAIAFIVALPATASSATPPGKPAAETAAKKKKQTRTKLWYRVAIDGRGDKDDQLTNNSGLRHTATGFDGVLIDSKTTETNFSTVPSCPGHTNVTTQITPGIVEGEVSGVLGASPFAQMWARGLGGRATLRTTAVRAS